MKKILLTACCIFSLLCNAQNWSPVGTGINGWSSSMPMIVYNGELYVGGLFTQAGGVSANNIVKWNGSAWSAVGSGITIGIHPNIATMAVYNGELYVAGSFTNAGGIPSLNIAKWNGTTWSAVGSGINVGVNGLITSMAVYNNELIIGGYFDTINGVRIKNVVAWNGSTWSALGNGITDGGVWTLCTYDSVLYAAGNFNSASGYLCSSIAQWNGTAWAPIGKGLNGQPSSMCILNKTLFVIGYFSTLGSTYPYNIDYWNGSTWGYLTKNNPSGQYSFAYCSLVAGNKIYVGGSILDTINGKLTNDITSWDGSNWDSVGSGLGQYGDSGVTSLCLYNNQVYATGDFTNSGATQTDHIAKWDTPTGITPIAFPNEFIKVSPNPSKGIFTFEIKGDELESNEATIEVYNMLGQKVLTASLNPSNGGTSVTSISLPNGEGQGGAGIYLYCVLAKDGSVIGSGKMVKE